ncbi:MAG: amino acid--tRNA ligase-related protein, partial [Patescibacteria group bacterium]
EQNAKNIDLFMMTPSISSPAGQGSDSEAIPIVFGKLDTFLTDSSQFGFEPLLMNGFNKVYCYLPSMRGEDYDNRHLNQFFHCELEIKGGIEELIPIIEQYVKKLSATLLLLNNIIDRISHSPEATKKYLNKILNTNKFPEISFDEAVEILIKNNKDDLVNFTDKGRGISSDGEIELMKILNIKTPIWIKNFDRDRVPFYQKPNPKNSNKVINADLLFPPITNDSLGGEIVGCGERQENAEMTYDSLARQGVSPDSYEWYIDLRKMSNYKTTSGFGLGVERFIAWALGKKDIKDAIIYPRLKNVLTYP